MKKNLIISAVFGAFVGLLLGSCSKSEPTLNASVPTGSFTYNALTPTGYANPYNLELISTSTDAMQAYWFIPGIGNFTGNDVKVTATFAGSYEVKMLAGGPGGLSDTVRQTITIDKDNPYAIDPNGLMGILTGAGTGLEQRTWIPERVVNSVIVWDNYDNCLGQINGGGGAWWAFGPPEIAPGTGRDGYLDDQYTFTFGNPGKYIYNDNNTIYLDNGGSNWTFGLPAPWNTFLGTTSSTDLFNLVPALKPWASGTLGYSIAPAPAGAKKLGTVTVSGLGAHLGLPDKTNSGDVPANKGDATSSAILPASVTYDILMISTGLKDASTGAIYDRIVLGLQEPGLVWTFMIRSDE